MRTVLPAEPSGVARARGGSSRAARARPSRPSRPETRRRARPNAQTTRTRVLCAGIGVFVAMAAAAIGLLAGLRETSGVLSFLPAFVATYLACAAWLTVMVVLMRRSGSSPTLALWAVGGGLLLVGIFVAQVVVARGG